MGTLGDNLLKLTEFPFSYSLIGLLALISGKGMNLDEPSLANLGPLLIIMGFVATTLSICDPVGNLQKRFLGGSRYPLIYNYRPKEQSEGKEEGQRFYDVQQNNSVRELFLPRRVFGYSPFFDIPWTVIACLLRNFQVILRRDIVKKKVLDEDTSETPLELYNRGNFYATTNLFKADDIFYSELFTLDEAKELFYRLRSLKNGTLGTTWIVREIDKITAMGYFVIVVSLFISAEFLLTGFLDKFLVSFQGSPDARIIILLFSIIALGAVLIMLYRRLSELRSKAWTTFRFLIELEAIKIEKTEFDKSLQEIEQYLSNGDWTMADYWVSRVMDEYHDLLTSRERTGERKEIRGDEAKDVEKKIMVKWKNGEMTVEEVRDVEKKISTEEVKNVEQKKE